MHVAKLFTAGRARSVRNLFTKHLMNSHSSCFTSHVGIVVNVHLVNARASMERFTTCSCQVPKDQHEHISAHQPNRHNDSIGTHEGVAGIEGIPLKNYIHDTERHTGWDIQNFPVSASVVAGSFHRYRRRSRGVRGVVSPGHDQNTDADTGWISWSVRLLR